MINKKESINTDKEETKKLDREKSDKEEIEEENLVLHPHLLCLVQGLLQKAKALEVDFHVK